MVSYQNDLTLEWSTSKRPHNFNEKLILTFIIFINSIYIKHVRNIK